MKFVVNVSLIENWRCVSDPLEESIPRQLKSTYIEGFVYDHPAFEDGSFIRTLAIVLAKKKLIFTASGEIYALGKVDPIYKTFALEALPTWDENEPIQSYSQEEIDSQIN